MLLIKAIAPHNASYSEAKPGIAGVAQRRLQFSHKLKMLLAFLAGYL